MKLPTEIYGDVIVVHTPEELGDENARRLEAFLTSQERSNVIVDLDGTENVDSSGLESLLIAQEALRALGGDLKLSTSNTFNRKILELTRLDQQFELFDSVIDAVKSFT